MTDNDRSLIRQAKHTHPTEWGSINPSLADTSEARDILLRWRKRKYKEEENMMTTGGKFN